MVYSYTLPKKYYSPSADFAWGFMLHEHLVVNFCLRPCPLPSYWLAVQLIWRSGSWCVCLGRTCRRFSDGGRIWVVWGSTRSLQMCSISYGSQGPVCTNKFVSLLSVSLPTSNGRWLFYTPTKPYHCHAKEKLRQALLLPNKISHIVVCLSVKVSYLSRLFTMHAYMQCI